jgi:hypothetical protein
MNFSYPIKFSGKSAYSHNGKYLTISKGYEVIVITSSPKYHNLDL